MTAHEEAVPIRVPYWTTGTRIVALIAGLGIAAYLYRMIVGLGAATNLDNQYPWGIWIAVDVASGVALAAGGFTTAALAHIFHKERYHALVRPALLTAMLGYTFVVVGLLADLGRYYNLWHPLLPSMWQGNSVLFEVGICVMIYLTVLYVEFLPVVAERFRGHVRLPGRLRVFNRVLESALTIAQGTLGRVLFVFIIAGVVLSCLHQSSLGTLMVIAASKMHPLWGTAMSPLLFLLSAIAVGFPMVIFESILASRSFGLKPERRLLTSIARYVPVLLGIYLAVRIVDLTLREVWPYAFSLSGQSLSFWVEILAGALLPLLLLTVRRVRESIPGLLTAASLVIFGVVLNRINVFLVAYKPLYPQGTYFPSVVEITVTIGLISALVLVYRWFALTFPVITVIRETGSEPEMAHAVESVKPASLMAR